MQRWTREVISDGGVIYTEVQRLWWERIGGRKREALTEYKMKWIGVGTKLEVVSLSMNFVPFVEKTLFPHELPWHPRQKSINWKCKGLLVRSELYSITYMLVLLPVAHHLVVLITSFLGIRKWESFSIVVLQDCLGYFGSLEFPYEV